jgi:hypothetical protein
MDDGIHDHGWIGVISLDRWTNAAGAAHTKMLAGSA